jgi:para-aminobenzoate synthetase component 1
LKPLVRQLDFSLTPAIALTRLGSMPHVCLLESAKTDSQRGRYSFLAADPFETIWVRQQAENPLAQLRHVLERFSIEPQSDLPPFQGGAAGLLSYELGACYERLPAAQHDEFGLPLAMLGVYDVVVAWDHIRQACWLVSQGLPETTPRLRMQRAQNRLDEFAERLSTEPLTSQTPPQVNTAATAHGLTAPQYETRLAGSWIGNVDSRSFRESVDRAIEYIYAGDIFQVNFAQRLIRKSDCDSISLYQRLRHLNPAPFAGYFDLGAHQVISASPERFLKVTDSIVETRPIKGTRARTGNIAIDEQTAVELQSSAKDRAENVMIVDLMRNDLSRVCCPHSIGVNQLCEIEAFQFVLHLVSSIEGKLRPDCDLVDLIAATFPGGSITGAPKVRAMEIIAELEPTARGAYCGSLGYFGFDGCMDTNILIRTITASRGWWQLQVGGGIVADSDPIDEETETWIKAAGLVNAIDALANPAVRPMARDWPTRPIPRISSTHDLGRKP